MEARSISIDRVQPSDYRPVSESSLPALSDSMKASGLINPITVTEATIMHGGIAVKGYQVVAGNHRLAAGKRLGWTEIDALVVTADNKLSCELMTIDENLMRSELKTAERSRHIARRKEIYETLYPETKHGHQENRGNRHIRGNLESRQFGDSLGKPSFSKSTAQATGRSERSIERDARLGSKVAPDVLERVTGTKFDRVNYLDGMARLSHERQRSKLERDIEYYANEKNVPKPKAVADKSISKAQGADIDAKRLDSLKQQFDQLTPKSQRAFIAYVNQVVAA